MTNDITVTSVLLHGAIINLVLKVLQYNIIVFFFLTAFCVSLVLFTLAIGVVECATAGA